MSSSIHPCCVDAAYNQCLQPTSQPNNKPAFLFFFFLSPLLLHHSFSVSLVPVFRALQPTSQQQQQPPLHTWVKTRWRGRERAGSAVDALYLHCHPP